MRFHPAQILVATDFSAGSRHAADAAGAMARAFGSKLTLLHVVPISLYLEFAGRLEGPAFPIGKFKEQVRRRVGEDADAELSRLREDGVFAEFLSAEGTPAVEIARAARVGHYDLVVVGARGRTEPMHLTLGSVAENVVRLCPVPVLAVRTPGEERPSTSGC